MGGVRISALPVPTRKADCRAVTSVILTPVSAGCEAPGMQTDAAHTFLPLHPEAFRILLVLREGPAHGYAVVKMLEADPGRPGRVMPANLYRRMRTLLDQELIAEADPPADADADDPRRRYFRLTALGERVARAEAHRLLDLLAGAADLLEG